MAELWAHSVNPLGNRHGLDDHLRGTAARAGRFGAAFGYEDVASYLGLVHDVGKGTCLWQERLLSAEASGGPVGIDHKSAGAVLVARNVADPLSMVILGHHGGLPSIRDVKPLLRVAASDPGAVDEAIEAVARLVPEILSYQGPGRSRLSALWASDKPAAELLVRMLFSCLVDADFLDTSAHFAAGTGRDEHLVSAASLVARFEARRAAQLARRAPSPIDKLRQGVYEQSIAAASLPRGVFRLQVPTGGGKTLAAGGFALRHAQAHLMPRVIVAVPFITVTDQNAQIYRDLLDDDADGVPVVLEHHSSVDLDAGPAGSWAKLAAENWDAPFIVTTTVQLFQSLFSRTPAAMRKVHRLANAVIVLDEVQALPDRVLVPILSALRALVEHFGATVLFASATQPEFSSLPVFAGLPVTEVIEDPAPLYEQLRRVRYEWRLDPRPTWDEVAEQVAAEHQCAVMVNTTRDAADLHALISRYSGGDAARVLHLSNRMVPVHRRAALTAVRSMLAHGDPVLLTATSLIEAGVDLDVPVLWRAWTRAESLQQAAGRCNREGRLASRGGRVVVFDPVGGSLPSFSANFKAAVGQTWSFFGPGLKDPDDLEALAAYYRAYLGQIGEQGLGREIQRERVGLDFPAVARLFQMIEQGQVRSVVCLDYQGPARESGDDRRRRQAARRVAVSAVGRLRSGDRIGRDELRALQPWTASLSAYVAKQAMAAGTAVSLIGDLLLWQGPYDPQCGIVPEALEDPREFIC